MYGNDFDLRTLNGNVWRILEVYIIIIIIINWFFFKKSSTVKIMLYSILSAIPRRPPAQITAWSLWYFFIMYTYPHI